ncbi:2,5-diamino-6-(ribosylamino)-4(3H)-pyrimidinone 5'-phosphate reductase [Methanoplanus sp. FWC-SCC4]|uniref:2,5-diamino-6-(ribosylamino)-4(3H)-pyrimidinone 5'-phosphate reductase n=1 Tax=Methanochimaera problematica TaxID=2609417 RepID=A0AA97FAL1_9EURY|nr:2,5-diamino-6-(ribosylamino)-4(3H)-pyrimidinone 5'-phosphate reductase [Methanoplanus sp. FWC-SCC4]WOF15865.1 2,5-diamino-6-(ribosylamino)-4(3H)-pyrimidinone 5'-phosphate reductase [Methanoplanus sp. FWC-SCC4]
MRPFIFVNLAMSADGKISTVQRRQVKISGKKDFERVDIIKADSDAIIVGIGTVLADNPSLTVKSSELKSKRIKNGKEENPIRVVIDSKARTPADSDILHKGDGQRIIAVSKKAEQEKIELLNEYADIVVTGEDKVDLSALMEALYEYGVRKIMVEGGGSLIESLFKENLVDEIYTCVGNVIIGGKNAPTPADGEGFLKEEDFPNLKLLDIEKIDEGILIRWKVVRD